LWEEGSAHKHLLSLWEIWAGELEARKQAATTPQKNSKTDGKENPPSARHGRLFLALSLSLFVAMGI
jgi:hypothetical protein